MISSKEVVFEGLRFGLRVVRGDLRFCLLFYLSIAGRGNSREGGL